MHGTIKIGHRTIHGAITRIPEGTAPQQRLDELKEQGIDAHLVKLGENEHRILLEDAAKVRIPRPTTSIEGPKPGGQQ